MTAPIYSLPCEVLSRIFLEAACHHTHDDDQLPDFFPANPVTISAVCRLWRTTAADCRSLWSHLDIVIDGSTGHKRYYPSSEIWERNLKGSPLQLHVQQVRFSIEESPENARNLYGYDSEDSDEVRDRVVEHASSQLFRFLVPLALHMDTVEFCCYSDFDDFLTPLFRRLIDAGKTRAMKSVKVTHGWIQDAFYLEAANPLFSPSAPDDYQAFFHSLSTLVLRNAYAPLLHMRLPHLVELRLESPPVHDRLQVTQKQVADVLASCPKLRSLMLFNQAIKRSDTTPRRIHLPDLQILSLRCSYDYGTHRPDFVLSLINPGARSLHMSISVPSHAATRPDFLPGFTSFIGRANVTVLYAENVSPGRFWFASEINPLPHVHTLALKDFYFADEYTSVAPSTRESTVHVNPSAVDPSFAPWPRLRKLYMSGCLTQPSHLHQILASHPIERLSLHDCCDKFCPDEAQQHSFNRTIRELLSHTVTDIQILDEGEREETHDWLFVGTRGD
ncbi:F-box-like protein [Ceratobasidium sp. AG-Ba]|nr:F-box-like protein [Ceratobasidium sp. AG-Ba]